MRGQEHFVQEHRKRPHGSMESAKIDAVDPASVAAMRLAVGLRDDCYQWCKEEGMYCSQDELLGWMDSEEPNSPLVLVVDTRDDDVAGGMIRGAIHAPDGTFADEGLVTVLHRASELLKKAQDAASSYSRAAKVAVVFHCMESVRRGPRCARRTHVYLRAAAAASVASPSADTALRPLSQSISLHVLQGGADQWIRRFFRDPSHTQGFDDDYWGFLCSDDEKVDENGSRSDGASGEGGTPASSDPPQHRLYHRPADQPATPWSAAGSNAMSNRS